MWDRQPLTKVFTLATLLVRTESSQGHRLSQRIYESLRYLTVILAGISMLCSLEVTEPLLAAVISIAPLILLILISSRCRCCFKCLLVCFIWSKLSLQTMIWILQTCWTNWTFKIFYLFYFSVVFFLIAWALASMGVCTWVHMSVETQNLCQVSFLNLSLFITEPEAHWLG